MTPVRPHRIVPMRMLVCALLGLVACDREKPAEPGRVPTAGLVLNCWKLHRKMRIRVDAKVADIPWKRTAELVVPLGGEGVSEVKLRAVHDDEYIYMLAIWPDKTRSFNRYWELVGEEKWKKSVGEDAFSICWSPGALQARFREQGCALFCHDGRHVFDERLQGTDFADFWYWGAQQTGAKLTLRDMRLQFGRNDRLRGDSQGENSDNILNFSTEYYGPWGVPRMVGPKRSPYFLEHSNRQQLTRKRLKKLDLKKNLGWIVALDIQRAIHGSRADVAARAKKLDDVWVLEMRRRLDTKNSDDQILNPDAGVPVLFSVAIHDGTERDGHTISGPIELRFVTKRWTTSVGGRDRSGK